MDEHQEFQLELLAQAYLEQQDALGIKTSQTELIRNNFSRSEYDQFLGYIIQKASTFEGVVKEFIEIKKLDAKPNDRFNQLVRDLLTGLKNDHIAEDKINQLLGYKEKD
jgi:hypothetical protein